MTSEPRVWGKSFRVIRRVLEFLGTIFVFTVAAGYLNADQFFGAFMGVLALAVFYYVWWLRSRLGEELQLGAEGKLKRHIGLDVCDSRRLLIVVLVIALSMWIPLSIYPTLPFLLVSILLGVVIAWILLRVTRHSNR